MASKVTLKHKLPCGTVQKIPRREYLLEGRALAAAFVVAQANWPGVELGYTGTDPKTFRHYFQEWGNPNPFVL